MRQRVESATINGWSVTTVKLAPLRGLELKATVAKIAVPMAGTIVPYVRELEAEWRAKNPDAPAGEQFTINIGEIDPVRVAPVLMRAIEHVEPKQLSTLITDILRTTSVTRTDPDKEDGPLLKYDLCDPGVIDRVFGDVADTVMWQVVFHALKTQFADFFGGSKPDRASPPTLKP